MCRDKKISGVVMRTTIRDFSHIPCKAARVGELLVVPYLGRSSRFLLDTSCNGLCLVILLHRIRCLREITARAVIQSITHARPVLHGSGTHSVAAQSIRTLWG